MVRPVTGKDVSDINRWLVGHGKNPVDPRFLPRTGVISPDVAAGFVYLTNSRAAWIETLVSNPDKKARIVSRAVDDIVKSLSELAQEAGALYLFAFTSSRGVAKKSKRLGFNEGPPLMVFSRRL